MRLGLFSEPIRERRCVLVAYACRRCPALEGCQSLLQSGTSLRYLRVDDRSLRIPVVRVQAQGQQVIADDIFLGGPPSSIRLCERHRIGCCSCRHNGDQLCSGRSHRRRRGLPVVFPPRLFQEIQVSIPPTRRLFLRLAGNLTTQIARRAPPATEGIPQVDLEAVRQSRPLLPRG
jgi:hypothetical protein